MKRATAADVAREAGVSRTTVSYVLNNTPHQQIPDATRRRVLEAVVSRCAESREANAMRS